MYDRAKKIIANIIDDTMESYPGADLLSKLIAGTGRLIQRSRRS